MSRINTLGIFDSVLREFFNTLAKFFYWLYFALVKAVAWILDMLTQLFFIFSGMTPIGTASSTSDDGVDIVNYFLKQSSFQKGYLYLCLVALGLVIVFTIAKIIKQDYFDRSGPRSKAPIFRSVALSFIAFICVIPIFYFLMQVVGALALLTMDALGYSGGGIGTLLFNLSWEDGGVSIQNFTQETSTLSMDPNNFGWYPKDTFYNYFWDSSLGEATKNIGSAPISEFYWYIFFLAGGALLIGLGRMMIAMISRLYKLIALFIVAPSPISQIVLDDGQKFRRWKDLVLQEAVKVIGCVMSFMVFMLIASAVDDIDLMRFAFTDRAASAINLIDGNNLTVELSNGINALYHSGTDTPDFVDKAINALGKALILMAGVGAIQDMDSVITPLLAGGTSSMDMGNAGKQALATAKGTAGMALGLTRNLATGVAGVLGGGTSRLAHHLAHRGHSEGDVVEGEPTPPPTSGGPGGGGGSGTPNNTPPTTPNTGNATNTTAGAGSGGGGGGGNGPSPTNGGPGGSGAGNQNSNTSNSTATPNTGNSQTGATAGATSTQNPPATNNGTTPNPTPGNPSGGAPNSKTQGTEKDDKLKDKGVVPKTAEKQAKDERKEKRDARAQKIGRGMLGLGKVIKPLAKTVKTATKGAWGIASLGLTAMGLGSVVGGVNKFSRETADQLHSKYGKWKKPHPQKARKPKSSDDKIKPSRFVSRKEKEAIKLKGRSLGERADTLKGSVEKGKVDKNELGAVANGAKKLEEDATQIADLEEQVTGKKNEDLTSDEKTFDQKYDSIQQAKKDMESKDGSIREQGKKELDKQMANCTLMDKYKIAEKEYTEAATTATATSNAEDGKKAASKAMELKDLGSQITEKMGASYAVSKKQGAKNEAFNNKYSDYRKTATGIRSNIEAIKKAGGDTSKLESKLDKLNGVAIGKSTKSTVLRRSGVSNPPKIRINRLAQKANKQAGVIEKEQNIRQQLGMNDEETQINLNIASSGPATLNTAKGTASNAGNSNNNSQNTNQKKSQGKKQKYFTLNATTQQKANALQQPPTTGIGAQVLNLTNKQDDRAMKILKTSIGGQKIDQNLGNAAVKVFSTKDGKVPNIDKDIGKVPPTMTSKAEEAALQNALNNITKVPNHAKTAKDGSKTTVGAYRDDLSNRYKIASEKYEAAMKAASDHAKAFASSGDSVDLGALRNALAEAITQNEVITSVKVQVKRDSEKK